MPAYREHAIAIAVIRIRARAWLLCGLLLIAAPATQQPQAAETGAAFSPGRLVADARAQIGVTLHYDGRYVRLTYPGGDVAADRGVCTDVVIRALRRQGIDLQQRVHEDMRRAFAAYPALWGLSAPDRNIDHRRVPNLETWFRRQGWLPVSTNDVRSGDIISWRLDNGLPHICIASDRRNARGQPLVIHNIGAGVQEEDVLHAWPVTGHFRLPGAQPNA